MKVSSLSKYAAYFFLGILAFLLAAILLLLSPVGVGTMVSLANDQEGVLIENASGSFYSEVTLGKVSFINEQIELSGELVKLDIGLNCIFAGEACIDNFSARNLDIVLKENNVESEASEPISEYIELPLAAYVHKFSIQRLQLYSQKIASEKVLLTKLERIQTSLSMHKNLLLNEFSVNDISIIAANEDANTQQNPPQEKVPTEDWIEMLKNAKYEPIILPEVFIPINAEINNVSFKKVCVEQATPLCLLNTQMNATINKQKITFNAKTQAENQLLSAVDLKAKLNLAENFSHDINISVLPNTKLTVSNAQGLKLSLVGSLTSTRLAVNSPKVPEPIISLTSDVDIGDDKLPVDIKLSAKNYQQITNAWLPQTAIPVSAVNVLIKGNVDAYQLSSSLKVDNEQAGELKLVADISLNDKYIKLKELKSSGDIGELSASLEAKLSQFEGKDGVAVLTNIAFNKLQLKPLLPNFDTNLQGNINLAASVTATKLWGQLNCKNVEGSFQGYDLSMLCDVVISKSGLVDVNALDLHQGKNHVTAKGTFELPYGINTSELGAAEIANTQWIEKTKAALTLNIYLADMSSLYPKAKGTVIGQIDIEGNVDKPNLVANIDINNLLFDELRLKNAKVELFLDIAKDWQTKVRIALSKIAQEALLAEQVDIEIDGNLSAHTLSVDLTHPDYSTSQKLSGEAIVNEKDWRWLGQWDSGVFASAFDSFVLEKPTAIRVNQNRASIRSHCWLSSTMSGQSDVSGQISASTDQSNKTLCFEQIQYSEALSEVNAKLNYNLKIPLLHYLPELIMPGSSLPLSTDIELLYSAEKGIQVDTYSLMTQANITTSKHKIELQALVANSSLVDQILKTNLFAGTNATGAIGLSSKLNLDPENRSHKGQLRIENFILSPLQRFIPSVEKLNGAVVGNIMFDGPLVEPELNGELQISDVELVLDNYPYPITNFNQNITIVDTKASIEGEFELGAGTADYSGTLTLFDEDKPFSFEGEINGAGMQLAFAENELLASPSLKIALDPGNFSLKGEVTIPNAQIKIEELPQSAKSPSNDTIVIGKPPEPPLLPIGLDIDIRILLDPPKLKRVTINALDLKASLGGDINVQVRQSKNPVSGEFTPLETYVYGSVNVLSGSYEAYGQNLQIQKGSIFFNGAPSLPQFDITAIRNPLNTADKVVAGIRVSGNPVIPKVELFSQPTMTQARQLSYLLQGTDINGGEGQDQDVMLVNMLVNFGVGNSENGVNRFGKSLGFDSLNLQTAGQGANTQVQLTGRLSDNIQVTYGVGLFDQASEVILRYQLLPQMYLEAKSGATSAVDVFYEWTRGE